MSADRIEAIDALLARAQAAHGVYEQTELNGVYDQDWPRWYAAYVVDHGIGELVGPDVTAERLAQFLASSYAEFQHTTPEPSEPWAGYTARRILAELG